MSTVPAPVGDDTTASWALKPMPPDIGDRNQGSSHPTSSITPAVMESIHQTEPACTWMRSRAGRRQRLRTLGHVDAEQAHRTKGEDDHQHGEDQRLTPLAAHQLAA